MEKDSLMAGKTWPTAALREKKQGKSIAQLQEKRHQKKYVYYPGELGGQKKTTEKKGKKRLNHLGAVTDSIGVKKKIRTRVLRSKSPNRRGSTEAGEQKKKQMARGANFILEALTSQQ